MSVTKTSLVKGDRIQVDNDSIFEMMGYKTVTGKVFLATEYLLSIQCDQTGAIESVDDGVITKL